VATRFWVNGQMPGLNEVIEACKGCGGRGFKYARLKKLWTENVAWMAKAAQVTKVAGAYRLELLWVAPINGNKSEMDRDNREAGTKFVNDGLKTAKLILDDSPDYYLGSTHNHMQGTKPGVWVTVVPVVG
jgi:hypothetical protein